MATQTRTLGSISWWITPRFSWHFQKWWRWYYYEFGPGMKRQWLLSGEGRETVASAAADGTDELLNKGDHLSFLTTFVLPRSHLALTQSFHTFSPLTVDQLSKFCKVQLKRFNLLNIWTIPSKVSCDWEPESFQLSSAIPTQCMVWLVGELGVLSTCNLQRVAWTIPTKPPVPQSF